MVVLTFLLAKAAYERFNSAGSGSEAEVEVKDGEKRKEEDHRRKSTPHHSNCDQRRRATKDSERAPFARAATFTSSSSSARGGDNGSGRRHDNLLDRKPGLRIRSEVDSGRPGRSGRGKKLMAGNSKFGSDRSGISARRDDRDNCMRPGPTMSSSSSVAQPTARGHFTIHAKSRLLALPPECRRRRLSQTKKSPAPALHEAVSSHSIVMVPASASEGGASDQAEGEGGGLSGAEMALTMMGETEPEFEDSDNLEGVASSESGDFLNVKMTTFRSDVKNAWVDAVFGKDFFPLLDQEEEGGGAGGAIVATTTDVGVRQGVGEANVPHYVVYGAVLDPGAEAGDNAAGGGTPNTNDGDNNSSRNNNSSNNNNNDDGGGRTPVRKPIPARFQCKTQSTPIIFSSPSSSSLAGGTLLASGSLTSLTPSVCGDVPALGGAVGGAVGERAQFRTPSGVRGETDFASFAKEGPPSASCGRTPIRGNNIGGGARSWNQQMQRPQPKLGMTISRIPLGLYVRSISLDSEAHAAGISPGSLLVDVNGVGMLAERSDRALERLWTYAGLLVGGFEGGGVVGTSPLLKEEGQRGGAKGNMKGGGNGGGKGGGKGGITAADPLPAPDLTVRRPLLLRLYRNSCVYPALLLSGDPLAGIEWAPCGNFALVHKVASGSIASLGGVWRGTFVGGVGGEGLRTLDHSGVAGRLRDGFLRGETLTVSMAYTPAASRSGFHEREGKDPGSSSGSDGATSAEPRSNNGANSIRDVEVRSRPVEYSSAVVETFFACTGPGAMGMVDDDGLTGTPGIVGGRPPPSRRSPTLVGDGCPAAVGAAGAAAYVAAGGILPPPGGMPAAASDAAGRRSELSGVGEGPKGGGGGRSFAPCPALPPERLFSPGCWNPLGSLVRSMAYHAAGWCETTYLREGGPFERLGEESGGEAPHSPVECLDLIRCIAGGAASSSDEEGAAAAAAEDVFDAHLLQLLGVAISPSMGAVDRGQRLSEKLMDIVIDVALNDINLCQRLFFLLRSFIGEFEEQKVPHGYISEESALAMRLCRYAQRRLSGRMFDKSARREKERHCSEGYPISRESTNNSRMRASREDYSHLAISASESSIGGGAAGTTTTRVSDDNDDEEQRYPSQVPTASPPSSLDVDNAGQPLQDRPTSPSVVESSSEDIPASHGSSSRENHDQNSVAVEHSNSNDPSITTLKKKSKSKKILRMLKGSGKGMRSFKKPSSTSSDHGSTLSSTADGGASSTHGNKRSPKSSIGKPSFSFPYVFHKQLSAGTTALQTIDCAPSPSPSSLISADVSDPPASTSLSRKFENTAWILRRLDDSCAAIEKNLAKTFSQKMADWALYPWSASKESALASVTQGFRSELRLVNSPGSGGGSLLSGSGPSPEARFPILNPVDPSELLTSVDADECFILPSAHFPLLLCFDVERRAGSSREGTASQSKGGFSPRQGGGNSSDGDTLYRSKVEIVSLHSTVLPKTPKEAFVIQGTVAGVIEESGVSDSSRRSEDCASYRWTTNNTLVFETRSNWGHPKALSLKVSSVSKSVDDPNETESCDQMEMGCAFVDLCPMWEKQEELDDFASVDCKSKIYLFDSAEEFDQHGQAIESSAPREEGLELHLRVSAEVISFEEQPTKRLLLYKHGDDLRQELLAIQFIERCNQILIAAGLDLRLKTFSCQPVGSKTGFIEWVRGTVPLSELCKSSGGSSHPGSNVGVDSRQSSRSKDGLTESEALGISAGAPEELLDTQAGSAPSQSHRWFKDQSLPGLRQKMNGSVVENPIQDFLRSAAFDESAPYLVKKDVMATYVKSCAGYCVITYLLGVGDRHLDNILLHQNGHLLHCDYSFILGQDPKTYLPMRITEEMIKGFGGRESDNFAKFLFFTGAAFLALRRHNNLRSLLSLICSMIYANMGDVSINQPSEEAILAMRGRFRLDLNDNDALAYIEDVVEKSITSKMWRAVDVMHSLGKHF